MENSNIPNYSCSENDNSENLNITENNCEFKIDHSFSGAFQGLSSINRLDTNKKNPVKENNERRKKELLELQLWEIGQVAEYLGMTIASVRNMATRNEIPGLKRINGKKWIVHVQAFVEWFKEKPKPIKANLKSIRKLRL